MNNNEINLGLVGFPLGHSFSKTLQEEALRITGLSGRYDLWEIAATPAGDQALKFRLDSIRKNQTKGINVTIPHKERVIPYLDSLTPIASAIGAVNTIYWDAVQNQLCGHNTDAPAFMTEVSPLIQSRNSKHALVLGAGGAARAVIYQLLEINWMVTIASRKKIQAEEIIRHFADYDAKLDWIDLGTKSQIDLESYRLIVNATPVGMAPDIDISPWPGGWHFPENAAVFDLIYNPAETRFIQQAKAAGLQTRNGLGMLVEQAALAFECWTNQIAPREEMLQSITALQQQVKSMSVSGEISDSGY